MMKKNILLLALFIPFAISAQERNRERNEEINIHDTDRSALNASNESPIFIGLGFTPDYADFIYYVESQHASVRPQSGSGEGYYFLNLLNLRNQRVSLFNDRAFVQWDDNGLYTLKNDELLISRDGGRRWQTVLEGLYGAKSVRVSPNGRVVAYTVEQNAPVRSRTGTRALMVAALDDIKFPLINVLEIAQEVPRRDLSYTPNVEQGVNDDFLFTADSRMLYFTNKRNNNANSIHSAIFKYDIWAKQATNLTGARKGFNGDLQLSPDGSKLAWLTTFEDQPDDPEYHLMVLDLMNNKQLNTTVKAKYKVNGPYMWGEKPDRLYFLSTTHLGESIFRLDITPQFRGSLVNLLAQSKVGDFTQLLAAYDKSLIAAHFNASENRMELVRVSSQNGLMDVFFKE